MARHNSLAANNQRRRRDLTTAGSTKKRSYYANKSVGGRINSAFMVARSQGMETVFGLEYALQSSEDVELVKVIMGSNQSTGLRCNKDFDIIGYVEAGQLKGVRIDDEFLDIVTGSAFRISSGSEWYVSSGDNGAALLLIRHPDYEQSVDQLTASIKGSEVPIQQTDKNITEIGTNLPSKEPRRRSKEERDRIAEATGTVRKITDKKRKDSEPIMPRSSQEVAPSRGKVIKDPRTGAEYMSTGPQPLGAEALQQAADGGQITGVSLKPEIQARLQEVPSIGPVAKPKKKSTEGKKLSFRMSQN